MELENEIPTAEQNNNVGLSKCFCAFELFRIPSGLRLRESLITDHSHVLEVIELLFSSMGSEVEEKMLNFKKWGSSHHDILQNHI